MSVLQVLGATDDAVLDSLQNGIRPAHGAEDADPLDRLVGQVGSDAPLDAQDADDEDGQPSARVAGSFELAAGEQLVTDAGVRHAPDRVVVRLEDGPDAVADDVRAAGEQALGDQDVDLAELRRGEVDADLLGLHSCSSQIPTSTLA